MLDRSVNFESLLTPVKAEQFLGKQFGKEPLYIPGDADKFSNIFSWQDLNQLMNMTSIWSDKNMRLVLESEIIDEERYCSKKLSRDKETIMRPNFHQVAAFMEQGATLNLNFVESLHDGIASAARALQMVFSNFIQCNVYSSWNQRKAFQSHFDSWDVFALHIAGEKVWRIYENRFDLPATDDGYTAKNTDHDLIEKEKGKLLREVTLTPGDLLYLPKGVYHDALATTGACLHLTFGVIEIRGYEVIKDIFASLFNDPLFRECLPHLDERDQLGEYLLRLGDRLREIMTLPEITEQVHNFQKRRAFENLPGFSMPSPAFDQTFRVTSRPAKLVRRGKTWRLNCGNHEAELAGAQAKMAEWILDGDYFDIDSIDEAFDDREALLGLIDELVNMGVIEPVAWAGMNT